MRFRRSIAALAIALSAMISPCDVSGEKNEAPVSIDNILMGSPKDPDSGFAVDFISVGHADSALIHTSDNKHILIDCGNGDHRAIDYLRKIGITRIDAMITSHNDRDHIGGCAEIIDSMEVGMLYDHGLGNDVNSSPFRRYAAARERLSKLGRYTKIDKDSAVMIGNTRIYFLSPYSRGMMSEDADNNNSLIAKITSRDSPFSFIFMGDCEERCEQRLVERYRCNPDMGLGTGHGSDPVPDPGAASIIDADVLKVGHHGSINSSSMAFLTTVTPLYSIISSDSANSYGQPSQVILKRLGEISHVMNTREGDIRCIADNLLICYYQRPF
ncbi:MAG: MBL fold metallo-hydrolase [Candidatus Woesearchaeota archaeon]|nr:MBL fold metallo-hydrolase [Candidatus Woesearchaeota archaeon]